MYRSADCMILVSYRTTMILTNQNLQHAVYNNFMTLSFSKRELKFLKKFSLH